MTRLDLKPAHKPIRAYYDSLAAFEKHAATKETSVRPAFADLLKFCARKFGWTLIEEYGYTLASGTRGAIDGAILTDLSIVTGYWEAKDLGDDLRKEIAKKFKAGYPQSNILFQTPERAILYQDKIEIGEYDLTKPERLIACLQDFFGGSKVEDEVQWEEAVESFKERMPEFGEKLLQLIATERASNPKFAEAFRSFADLCKASINPNLSDKAVEEMLIQHLLTRRIFATVFGLPDFIHRNPIGQEIEKVVGVLTSRNFNSEDFFKPLEHFYARLEQKARTITVWEEKQQFLNTVYEKFFQGFSVKVADTHGIVYTPQPIVDFMVRSVQHILKTEFNRSLAHENVHILDPFVGTGSFMMRIIREIGATQKSKLPQKYKNELHCNEVMLLPYYIASMNIEHEYYQQTKHYEPFDGICLVDTFELAEPHQTSLFTTENTERVERQKRSPIFVIIGNPPYNAGQVNENDNNKNRKYPVIDKRIADTYAKGSQAKLLRKLYDPYVKAFRFASDRVIRNKEGVVAFISNNSYLTDFSFDRMRASLFKEFNKIYVLDLGGNARKGGLVANSNVFDITVGVSITLLVKTSSDKSNKIYYHRIGDENSKKGKFDAMKSYQKIAGVDWREVNPDSKNNWISDGLETDYDNLISVGHKKSHSLAESKFLFQQYSLGLSTNRDSTVYSFNHDSLRASMENFSEGYNDTLLRFKKEGKAADVDSFVEYSLLKWSRNLKRELRRGNPLKLNDDRIRLGLYRPFVTKFLYLDDIAVDEPGSMMKFFPEGASNTVIALSDVAQRAPFSLLASDKPIDLHLAATTDAFQCFPFYTYTEDGGNRKENITDWALEQFRERLASPGQPTADVPLPAGRGRGSVGEKKKNKIPPIPLSQQGEGLGERPVGKWDIFYYVYGLLHHPGYRTKYAANLRRELPRIPLPNDSESFWKFSEAGKQLAELHVNYESQPEYDLEEVWSGEGLDLRVEKMKLMKDKTAIVYNQHLTLRGIPAEAFEYRLGNRSAIDWIIDQYQLSTDKRSGIVNDPNRADNPGYILSLIKRVVTVSVETVKIVREIEAIELA